MQWAPRNVARAPHVLILGAQRAPKKFSEAAALCFSVTRDYIHKNQLTALWSNSCKGDYPSKGMGLIEDRKWQGSHKNLQPFLRISNDHLPGM